MELVINAIPDLEVINDLFCTNESIIWTDLVRDNNNTVGSTAVFANFRDALNNQNPLPETSFIADKVASYFYRKTTDAGCYDIEIIIVIPQDCDDLCLAEAGSLNAVGESCFDGFLANLVAVEGDSPLLPTDYVQGFIITQGDSLEIIGINEIPEYIVESPGSYAIHSFVFSPFDMDLDSLAGMNGLNSLFELYEFTIEGGGIVCASVDLEGARFEVGVCTDVCPAFTASPTPGSVGCYDQSPVVLEIDFNPIDNIIPEGFIHVFVLTSGPEMIVIGLQSDFFEVEEAGEYRVHSIVFDPNTLDPGIIDLGVTSAFDMFGLTIEGGGDICASFDLNGALFVVEDCEFSCEAFSGNTLPGGEICYDGLPIALPVAVSDDLVIPDGFIHSFIITEGSLFTIIGLQEAPFEISSPGSYEVNSFVYDPSTFDESLIVFGESSFFDVYSELLDGGGAICGSLDFFGASFDVENCPVICDLELNKTVSNLTPSEGEEVTFTIEIFNNSDIIATGVAVADRLPNGYTFTDNLF